MDRAQTRGSVKTGMSRRNGDYSTLSAQNSSSKSDEDKVFGTHLHSRHLCVDYKRDEKENCQPVFLIEAGKKT